MPEEPEEGFVIRDRRRFLSDEAETPTPPAAAPAAPTPPPVPAAPPLQTETSSPVSAFSGPTTPSFGAAPSGVSLSDDADAGAFDPVFGDLDELSDLESASVYGDEAQMGADASGAEAGPGEIPDVYSMLLVFLEQMRGLALLYMGLIQHPDAQQVGIDLEQAKVAINTVGFIVSQLEPVIAPEERMPIKAMVSDLQVAFVERAKQLQAAQNPALAQPGMPGQPGANPSPFAQPGGQSGASAPRPGGNPGSFGPGGFPPRRRS